MINKRIERMILGLFLGPQCDFIGTTAALIGAGIAAGAGSTAKGALGASAAKKAASTQSQAALQAKQLEAQQAAKAEAFQKQQYYNNLALQKPFYQTGVGANATLGYLMGVGNPNWQQVSQAYKAPQYPNTPSPMASLQSVISGAPDSASAVSQATAADPNVSPDAATTQQWEAQGIPLQYIPLPGGGSIARRTDNDAQQPQAGQEQAQQTMQYDPNDVMGKPQFDGSSNVGGFGSLAQDFTEQFKAPDSITEQNDPGFQARLQQGQQALERSAAARGNVLSGGTLKDLGQFSQDYASNEYGNVYNRAFNEFSNRYNIFKQNQTDKFNRYSALSNGGQVAAQSLGTLGNQSAGQIGNTLVTSGAQQGQAINDAAAARASGYVGSANAWGGTIGDISKLPFDLMNLNELMKYNKKMGRV
jgi:hypothetical protein